MEKMVKNYYRSDVFYADLGEGRKNVQGGIRPVIIIQNNIGNKFSPNLIVAPITSQIHNKAKLPTHVELNYKYIGLNQPSMALLETPLTISKDDVKQFVGRLNIEDIVKVNNALAIATALKEKTIKEDIYNKLNKIKAIDDAWKLAIKTNVQSDDFYKILEKQRGVLVKDLENYCRERGLNHLDFLQQLDSFSFNQFTIGEAC